MPPVQIQAAVLGLLLAGCSASSSSATGQRPFAVRAIASFDTPWAMTFLPGAGGRPSRLALVSERDGRLWLVDVASGKRRAVAGVPSVHVAGQGGLGDVVLHPGFAANRLVYLSFVEKGSRATSGAALGHGRLGRGSGPPRIEGFRIIWRQSPKVGGDGHFSHRIAFSPDGALFLSSGDRQKMAPAQRLDGNLGKILRLDAEGRPVPGNPWASRGGRAAEFWTIGHRNILGLAFAPDGRLWATEMGPQGGDELNLIARGRNHGWPLVSNGSHYGFGAIPDHAPGDGFAAPSLWWNPSISPAGMIVYSGELFPGWKGDAIFGGLSGEALVRADLSGARARKADHWPMGARIREVEQGPGGEIYLLEDGGRLLVLTPARR